MKTPSLFFKGLWTAVFFFFFINPAYATQIVAVVIDSGFNHTADVVPLCKNSPLDFTASGSPRDASPRLHGTNVAGLIAKSVGSTGYCIIVIKVYKTEKGRLIFDGPAYIAALKYLQTLKPAIINISLAGTGTISAEELPILKGLLDSGTQIVAAAGNDGDLLEPRNCYVYPACADPRVVVVGNSESEESNYGPVIDVTIDGNNKRAGGVTLSGSSQSAAIFTGQIIKKTLELQAKGVKDATSYFSARKRAGPVVKFVPKKSQGSIQMQGAN